MSTAVLDPQLRNQIIRFIHVGLEKPKYYPGCWSNHEYFEPERLTALDKVFEGQSSASIAALKLIQQVGKEGWYTRFETVAFALAKFLRLSHQDSVKEQVYRVAVELCTTPEKMMLFNKYTRLLKTGNGRGWCKSIKSWYLQKDPMELAKDVTRVRARHGRSHKTMIRKSHIKLPDGDFARDAVVKYVIHDLKRAKLMLGNKEGTKEIFDYIQKVEDMRHCEDPAAAAAIATANQFTLEHVPSHLLTAQDVWDAVLPQMGLRDILQNLQRIHNMGFLTSDSTTTAVLVSLLNNKDVIMKSEVTPIEVFITLNNYKHKTRHQAFEKAKIMAAKEERRRSRQIFDPKTGLWEWSSTKRHPTEIKNWGIEKPPEAAVIAALNNLIDLSWTNNKPTNKRYLITLDMRHHMFKGRHFCKAYKVPNKGKKTEATASATAAVAAAVKAAAAKATTAAAGDADPEKKSKRKLLAECFYHNTVTPGHAAIIMALQILKREKNARLAVFTEEGIQIVALERNFVNIEEAEFQLRKLNLGRVQLDAPIEWAAKNKQKIDVFINCIDRTTRYMELDQADRGGRGSGGRYGPAPMPDKNGAKLVDHCPVRALERYRTNLNLRNSKLVVMNLASHRIETTDDMHEGVLDVVGIDEYVPKVLDAFALGHFK